MIRKCAGRTTVMVINYSIEPVRSSRFHALNPSFTKEGVKFTSESHVGDLSRNTDRQILIMNRSQVVIIMR